MVVRKKSQKKIENVFLNLIQTKEINQISVSKICELANVNRTTFYANYLDIFDLVDKVKERMLLEFADIFKDQRGNSKENYLKMFKHIKDNQVFYKTYFKLGFDNDYKICYFDEKLAKDKYNNKFIDYHCEFFKAGITAIIKKWLNNNCLETPEDILEILESEYKKYEQQSF